MTPGAAYTARAAEYIARLGTMSAVHPSDRRIVETWAEHTTGPVLDAGCGPGHWTDYLTRLGLDARGVDLVPSFIEHARSAYPRTSFELRSIEDTSENDGSLGGVLSWFSTIHHDPDAIETPFAEFARILRPSGQLVLGFFDGSRVESFDHAVTRAYRWPAVELQSHLDSAGFDVLETHIRHSRGERPVGVIVCARRTTGDPAGD